MAADMSAVVAAPEPGPPPVEIVTQDHLEAHAIRLAATHRLTSNPRRGRPLLPRLDRSAERLDEAYRFLSVAARLDPQPVGSEDWLRDNYHVVLDQVRQIRQDLPRRYYLELPKLAEGRSQGYPRVYVLARELIAHTLGRIDLETLLEFASAYQRAAPLTIGEIWAIPIMLRLGLVEELRRLSDGVVAARHDRERARGWHTELVHGGAAAERSLRRLLEEGRRDGRLPAALVVELLQSLRDQPGTAAPAWQVLHRALEEQDDTADEMLRLEHQREAADQVAIGNIITSMRRLSAIDWTLFFERVSLVERTLRGDPAGAYGLMDPPTRDRYRHSVEQLARRTGRPEAEMAALAVDFARTAQREDPSNDRRHHVGYYLVSRGRFRLEQAVGYRPFLHERFARFAFRHPAIGYLGGIAALTALSIASVLAYANRHGGSPAHLWLIGVLVLLPVSELAISLINHIITSLMTPRQLPKLAMREGIPDACRTLVVVPTIVGSIDRLDALLHDLEVRFLGNRDDNLLFALLSDFPDADAAQLDGDVELLAEARRRIDALNDQHGERRFFFLQRERRWNPSEGRWMGWERKRGKLMELNRLLRGATDTSFTSCYGECALLGSVRYVITLDSDTQLPMDAARRLVGALAHPLNRPRFDPAAGRVTEGYGVLQPRVGVNVVSANRTAFAKVYSGHVGIDPYTTAVSDIYQDLFHEGSYVGKGIYDVDAFEAALAGRVPDNALLSHDLFEGSYARAGLSTDIHLVDDYPSHYLAFAARQHRWIRGDWQIARWLWPTVPDGTRRPVRNTLPVIARWKILDNLRRSLLPLALVLLLAAGWTVLPGSAAMWTVLVLLVLAFPAYIQVGRSLGSRLRGVPLREHVAAERDNLVTSARQALFSSVFLAHQAWLAADAIVRTIWRLLVTRRRLLDWVSADAFAALDPSPSGVVRQMWAAPAVAAAIGLFVLLASPHSLPMALPFIAAWVVSPAVAFATASPLTHARQAVGQAERSVLRRVARRTWRFFDDLVGRDDHWLVPDNYQENRQDVVAHRTSPTNIGLQLVSTLAAADLGYLSASGVVDRLDPVFATLQELPRYQGHFYNWYDTRTLAPLSPAYISTVDSGNLAGYLLTLRVGLVSLVESDPLIDARALEAVEDEIGLCEEALAALRARQAAASVRAIRTEMAALRAQLRQPPGTLAGWRARLAQIRDRLSAVSVLLHEIDEMSLEPASADARALAEAVVWLEGAAAGIVRRQADLQRFASWAGDAVAGPDASVSVSEFVRWCGDPGEVPGAALRAAIAASGELAEDLIDRATRLAETAEELVAETEFGFLFNREVQLFSIGFSVTDGRLDGSHYDTLASEARLASFVAIATGQIPQDHWFKLARSLTPTGHARALLSWSASMFEYFMPLLVMRAYPGTLLDETYHAVVVRQMQYAAKRSVPWGISESAYNVQDLEGNYQYRAFGVPGLGLKRGLADDLVIAPYASLLAAPLVPQDVVRNLHRMTREGLLGRYGFREAIDYTPERRPESGRGGVVLPTWMAHHQGMILLAIDNALYDAPMQRRFHADPRVQAADLLLQERLPHIVPLKHPPIEIAEHVPSLRVLREPTVRRYVTPHTDSPRVHLLSNGSYSVMVTNAGGGYSRRRHLALTRWREDVTCDDWGSFCYVRDREDGAVWSTAYQPTARTPEQHEMVFAPDRAVWRRLDAGIETRTEIVVSPEDEAELRRVSVTNHSARTRTIELTSYAEVVLATGDADLAHPAFSNLFIETRSLPERDALMCVRRPRIGNDRHYLVHVLSGRGRVGVDTQFETDRARFIGRGGTRRRPAALAGDALSNTTGAVLDPIVSLRQSVRLAPGATARLTFTTAYAENEETARLLIDKYHDRRAIPRALALASTHSQIELRHRSVTPDDALMFQRLASRLVYGDRRLRDVEAIARNRWGQRDLWKHGISGDLPIVLVRVGAADEVPLVAELLKAHDYLRVKGLPFDLVVLSENPASYLQSLHEELQRLVEGGPALPWIDKPAGVFLRRADLLPREDQVLLRAAARAVMLAADGGLRNQLARLSDPIVMAPDRTYSAVSPPAGGAVTRTTGAASGFSGSGDEALEFFNGIGGFAGDGREYVVRATTLPPVPWINVAANDRFGFACTESGPGYTWSGNSHDNRLTPWCNDPVADPPGEAVFIQDERTGRHWSATPLPAGGGHPYTVRHTQGSTTYQHEREALESELTIFVPDDTVKIFRLSIRNGAAERRRLSVTLYVDWVVGENRSRGALHVVTGTDTATGAIMARNVFRQEFAGRVAFLDLFPGARRSITGDRTEFIGRNGSLDEPAALARAQLSNRTGAALDPCGAVRVSVELDPGATEVLVGQLGDAAAAADVPRIVQRFRDVRAVDEALGAARGFWDDLVGRLTVRTPDRAMDLLLNRWIPYQTLSCRVWGRSAFYQSSGAYGFRDQLQDTLALLPIAPAIARAHLLHAASRQFVEGDVQHWWHEPGGQGVRTRFSDDRLWLVYAATRYVEATGDRAVLDEHAPFLTGRMLNPDEHDAYEVPSVSDQTGSLYEHCRRAIAMSLATGPHGLPLIGTGDWNDGMNMVGPEGRGESVWLAWFLIDILRSFAPVARARGDGGLADTWEAHAAALAAAAEQAWDGAWYRRAYFDDGTPLGSHENGECQIDAIAQSWAVISSAGDAARARQAMESVHDRLVRRDDGLILLLTPPFDRMTPSPGYIQGYLPGVRENGGQYTHAAIWTVLAFARLGDGDRAADLFALLNPVNHARTPDEVSRYRAEPYVVAADVYSVPPHTGRGGWTWYTGSAGWMYRVGIEAILGLTLRNGTLHVDPCIPRTWPGFDVTYQPSRTPYRVIVENPEGVNRGVRRLEVDGADRTGQDVTLVDDGAEHVVRVVMGAIV